MPLVNFRDRLPPSGPQLHLIAILTLDLHIPEPKVDSFGEAGRLISDLYAARRLRRHAIQTKRQR